MATLKETLIEDRQTFQNYINDVKKHKYKMISPKVQGQVMASAGVIAYIDALLVKLDKGDIQ